MIEASNTEDKVHNDFDTEMQAIDDAADVLLMGNDNNFDEDELEADQIRLKRIG